MSHLKVASLQHDDLCMSDAFMSDPYRPAASQRIDHGPAYPWAAPPTAPRGASKAVAMSALVIGIIALVWLLALTVFVLGSYLPFGATGDMMGEEYTLTGTAAQVEQGTPYTGDRLVVEVERVLENDWSTFEDISCDDVREVLQGVTTSCSGVVDDFEAEMSVEFEDDEGHFTLVQHW